MLLLGLAVTLIVLGLTVLAVMRGPSHWFRALISLVAITLAVFGLLWTSSLLLPPVVSWTAAALGVFILAFTASARLQETRVLPLLMAVTLAAFSFHITLSVLDLAISTRHFVSDRALLLQALSRSISTPNLLPLAALVALVVGGALGGRWFGARRRRRLLLESR